MFLLVGFASYLLYFGPADSLSATTDESIPAQFGFLITQILSTLFS
jgi:hypothetical protein